MFRFASPWFLTLLLLIPLIAAWRLLAKKQTQPSTLRYADIRFTHKLSRSWRLYLYPLLPILRLLTISLIIIAVARPQTGQSREIIKGEGVDIALAVDISGSMAALDFEPQNRLEATKQVIGDFVAERTYDRIGLVVFASEAFNQTPPTIDHSALLGMVNQVRLSTDLGIESGTAIGLGLANAANMLKDSTAKSKIVILLTDGVNNAGLQIDPLTAAEAAKSLGIRVYTIGAGRPGQVRMPGRDIFGQAIYQESEIDEETLQQIADITGGLYFRAENTTGLQQIYNEINTLEKSQVEIRTYTRYQELAIWLLTPALLLFLLEMLLKHTLLRKIP